MFVDELLINSTDDVKIYLNSVEIKKRYTKFVGSRNRNGSRVSQIFIDQVGDQRQFGFLGSVGCILKLVFRNDTVLHHASGQACKICL